jgi:hypothetical protein
MMTQAYRTPYDVFESLYGPYNPDGPHTYPFSCWMSEEKSAYLTAHPEAARNQIDGHFFDAELERFFRWISARERKTCACDGLMKPTDMVKLEDGELLECVKCGHLTPEWSAE